MNYSYDYSRVHLSEVQQHIDAYTNAGVGWRVHTIIYNADSSIATILLERPRPTP